MYDSLLAFLPKAEKRIDNLDLLGIKPREYCVATVHRAENTDNPDKLAALFSCMEVTEQTVIFPMHPRTARAVEVFELELPDNVHSIDPVSYLDMLILQRYARAILTDSGGVQKEAYFLSVPCITLREETEWVETVDAGWNTLVGVDPALTKCALEQTKPKGTPPKVFGDGNASEKIVSLLERRM
jgi:UDP-N-acetylglucosamine 2-epimerase